MSHPASHINESAGSIAPSWFDAGPSQAAAKPASPEATHTGQPSSPAAHPVDSALIGRTSVTLVVVIGVILVCAWLLKRLGFQRNHGGERLRVVSSRSLGQRERVVIVEVENEWLVLGVTPQQINTLHRRPIPDDYTPSSSPGTKTGMPTFGQALTENLSRLRRREPK